MAAEDELKDIKEILASIRDQNKIANTATQSAMDYKQYAAELRLARDELNLLEKGTGAYNRKLKEVDNLSRLTKNALKDQRREADLLSLSINGLSGAMDMLGNSIDTVVVKLAGLVSSVMADVKELDNLTVQFQAATGASAAMASNIGGLTDRMRVFGVSNEEAAKAVNSMYSSFTLFTRLNEETQDKLLDTVALMGELGMSADTSAKLLEFSFRNLGTSVQGANDLLIDMRGTARALEIPIEQLSSDFMAQESIITSLGSQGVDAFKKIAAASKSTGVSVDGLMGIYEKFNDFDFSAKAAAQLQTFGIQLDFIAMQIEQDPLRRVQMLRDAFVQAGIDAESFTRMAPVTQQAMVEGITDTATMTKVLRGELDELSDEATQTQYTFEEMKKDALGLKGFDKVLNNMMNSFKRPIEEIQKAGRRTFEAFTPTIKMFEEFSERMVGSTQKFVANNSELIGGLALAYNMFNLDVVQQGYNAFKGIMSFSGTILSNMFTFKGLIAGLVGGGLYLIRDQLGDIIDTFQNQGIIGGLKALGSAFLDVFNEFKTKAIAAGFDSNFFTSLSSMFFDAAIFGFYKIIDFLAPIFDAIQVQFIVLFEKMQEDGTFDRIGEGIGYIFTKALEAIPIIGDLIGFNSKAAADGMAVGIGAGAVFGGPMGAAIGGAIGGLGAGFAFDGPEEEAFKARTPEQVAADIAAKRKAGAEDAANRLAEAKRRMEASTTAFGETKGAKTMNQKAAVVMEKTGKVMDVIEPRLAQVSTTMEKSLGSLKEGFVNGLDALVRTLGEMNEAQLNPQPTQAYLPAATRHQVLDCRFALPCIHFDRLGQYRARGV